MFNIKWGAFLLYIIVLAYLVFFLPRRQELEWSDSLINIIPVRNQFVWFTTQAITSVRYFVEFLTNLIGNIALFIPLPFFMKDLFKVKNIAVVMVTGTVISFLIEVSQYYLRVGVPDIDDVLLNTFGVIAGIYSWEAAGDVLKLKNVCS